MFERAYAYAPPRFYEINDILGALNNDIYQNKIHGLVCHPVLEIKRILTLNLLLNIIMMIKVWFYHITNLLHDQSWQH